MKSIYLLIAAGILGACTVLAGPNFPKGAQPLSAIVLAVETQGYQPVEVDFENGRWEMEAYRDGQKHKLWVDAVSGKISIQHLDD